MNFRHHIRIATGRRILVAIDDFEIPDNRITLLLGESGIGKSLIAKTIYGSLDSEDLAITVDGNPYADYARQPNVMELKRNSFFVFQEPSTHLNPLMTLESQLNEGTLGNAPGQGEILSRLYDRATPEAIRRLLAIYPKPYRPSGGEKQRVLLAMAFKKMDLLLESGSLQSRELFVFDEPTGSLDNYYRNLFLDMLFERFRTLNFTALIITHDYSMIGRINEKHGDSMGSYAFKELTLMRDRLELRDFQPQEYLGWLASQQPVQGHTPRSNRTVPFLTVESGAKVHDRQLFFSKDREGRDTCALSLLPGGMAYLKAASGVGKTTIVKAVMGLVRSERLNARIGNYEVTEKTPRKVWQKQIWGKEMTLVFQHADEALNPESTVKQTLAGLQTLRNASEDEIKRRLAELFEIELDTSFLNRKVKYLSGGQKQRLNLLRALCLDTKVLILDEPLNGLDFESAGKVVEILRRRQYNGAGILIISHNEEIFDRIVDKNDVYYLKAQAG